MIANGFEDGDQEKLSHAPKTPCLPRTPIRRMQNVSSCTNFRISWRNCNKKAPRLDEGAAFISLQMFYRFQSFPI